VGARTLALATCCAAAVLLTACAGGRGLPPIWERETDLPGGLTEERAWFGIATRTTGGDGARLAALRPLVTSAEDEATGFTKVHFLAPLGMHFESPAGSLTALRPIAFDTSYLEESDDGTTGTDSDQTIFPLLAWGDEPGEGSYFAFFPFGGTMKGRLLADRIDFVAFPAYVHTRRGDWESTHVLWPLIAWGDSPTRSHRRFMPFWSQTDSETEHRRTLLWPFVHWSSEVRDGREFDAWFVFPLLGHRTSADGSYRGWSALWPFFHWSHDDRTDARSTGAFWPVYYRTSQPGVSERQWWWPLWGRYHDEEEDTSFYLWPLVWTGDERRGGREVHRRFVVPVWMRRWSGPRGAEADEDEIRAWPLFSYRRRASGYESVRVPEILPFFGWEAGETLYADLLTVVRWSADRDGRAAWDGPLGTVRYRRDAAGARKLTLLWWIDIPLGGGG
jgi:hypothetical protein